MFGKSLREKSEKRFHAYKNKLLTLLLDFCLFKKQLYLYYNMNNVKLTILLKYFNLHHIDKIVTKIIANKENSKEIN